MSPKDIEQENISITDRIDNVISDLQIIQEDPDSRCREIECAITKLEEAVMWLEKRKKDIKGEE